MTNEDHNFLGYQKFPLLYVSCKLVLIFRQREKKKQQKNWGLHFAIMLIMSTYPVIKLHTNFRTNRSLHNGHKSQGRRVSGTFQNT